MKASRPFSEAETAEVMGLKEIPGVVSVSCGPNYTKRGQGYTTQHTKCPQCGSSQTLGVLVRQHTQR